MFDVFIVKVSGEKRNYRNVSTMSFSGSRVILTFKDGSMVKVLTHEIEELKTLVNVRRVNAWDS